MEINLTQETVEHLFDDETDSNQGASESPVAFLAYETKGNQRRVELFHGETTIGRVLREGSARHIVVDHPTVSALHVRLTLLDGRCLVADLGSTNGTVVNQVYLTERFVQYELKENDALKLGDVRCRFLLNSGKLHRECKGVVPSLCFFPPSFDSKPNRRLGQSMSCRSLAGGKCVEIYRKSHANDLSSIRDDNAGDLSKDVEIIEDSMATCVKKTDHAVCADGSSDDVIFCALVKNKEKQYENILGPVELPSSHIYDFEGLGAEKYSISAEQSGTIENKSPSVESESRKNKRKTSCSSSALKMQRVSSPGTPSYLPKTSAANSASCSKRSARLFCAVHENAPDLGNDKRISSPNMNTGKAKVCDVAQEKASPLSTSGSRRSVKSAKSYRRHGSALFPDFKSFMIFFLSGFSEEHLTTMIQKIGKMGADLSFDIRNATHVVGVKVRRTANLVCAVARRIPIVSEEWIDDCIANKTDNWKKHLLYDPIGEHRAGVVIRSIYKEPPPTFLHGFQIYATSNVMPSKEQIDMVAQCVGAKLVASVPKEKGQALVLTSKQDYGSDDIKLANQRGIPVIEGMTLLAAICRNNTSAYKLIMPEEP